MNDWGFHGSLESFTCVSAAYRFNELLKSYLDFRSRQLILGADNICYVQSLVCLTYKERFLWRYRETFFILLKKIFIVIQLQLYAFSPHPSTPPQPNPPPSPTSTLPLDLVHVSFIVVPVIPSPHCPLPTPPWLLLDCS